MEISEYFKEKIIESVEKSLPRFSGENKVFLVSISTGDIDIKIVFWRPRGYTMVAHDHEIPSRSDSGMFIVTSYHDSCWRYDGLSFIDKLTKEQKENLELLSMEVIEPKKCFFFGLQEEFFIMEE